MPQITECLKDPEPSVRGAAATALGAFLIVFILPLFDIAGFVPDFILSLLIGGGLGAFAALRKDMRQLISRLSQHLDLLEQPRTAPPAAAAREPEPVQSAAGAAATLRTDKVGLTLAQAVQAMVRDAMLAEDAGQMEEGVERPAAAGASLQPRLVGGQ